MIDTNAAKADLKERVDLLRDAFASNGAGTLAVVSMEIDRNRRIVEGLHSDVRLNTDEERALAAFRLTEYEALKAELRSM